MEFNTKQTLNYNLIQAKWTIQSRLYLPGFASGPSFHLTMLKSWRHGGAPKIKRELLPNFKKPQERNKFQ